MYKQSLEFRKHSENVSAVRKGLLQIERAHKQAIRTNDAPAIDVFRRLHTLTIGMLAEAMLRKIVTDPNGFNDRERELVWRVRSQMDRWSTVVELAFRRHYSVPIHLALSEAVMPHAAFVRFQDVTFLLSNELAAVIQDRNKTAHAQWIWQLRSGEDDSFKVAPAPDPPNYSVIRGMSDLILLIAQLVYILAVSEPTFAREYADLTAQLDVARSKLDGAAYPEFVQQLRRRVP